MKIVIDIPEEQAQRKCEFHFTVLCDNGNVELLNNTQLKESYGIDYQVLPKGHGSLMDANVLLDKWHNVSIRGRTEFDQVIMCTEVIIPADKGE